MSRVALTHDQKHSAIDFTHHAHKRGRAKVRGEVKCRQGPYHSNSNYMLWISRVLLAYTELKPLIVFLRLFYFCPFCLELIALQIRLNSKDKAKQNKKKQRKRKKRKACVCKIKTRKGKEYEKDVAIWPLEIE